MKEERDPQKKKPSRAILAIQMGGWIRRGSKDAEEKRRRRRGRKDEKDEKEEAGEGGRADENDEGRRGGTEVVGGLLRGGTTAGNRDGQITLGQWRSSALACHT
jgi:hypothetical protein